MDAISILKHEHEAILFGLGILDRAAARASTGDAAARADLPELVRFLSGFADRCHHGKEEGILFPALEAAGMPREGGPIGVMLEEHRLGRSFIRDMGGALGSGDYAAFARAVAAYSALLRAHIEKEDGVLFPAGAEALGRSRLEAMGGDFDRFEETVMGPGEHERLHSMLEEFAGRYR